MAELAVDIALIVPVWPICQQSGGLVARDIEAAGIPTVTFNLIPEIVPIVGIPRAVKLKQPFGRTLGKPNDALAHQEAIRQALLFVEAAAEPGAAKDI